MWISPNFSDGLLGRQRITVEDSLLPSFFGEKCVPDARILTDFSWGHAPASRLINANPCNMAASGIAVPGAATAVDRHSVIRVALPDG